MPSKLHKRRRLQRLIYSKPVVVLLAVVAAFSVYWAYSAYQKMATTGDRVTSIKQQKEVLHERKDELQADIARLQTRRGKEAEIRRKYSMTKEGEQMVVIMDRPTASSSEQDTDQSVWSRIWAAVIGVFD